MLRTFENIPGRDAGQIWLPREAIIMLKKRAMLILDREITYIRDKQKSDKKMYEYFRLPLMPYLYNCREISQKLEKLSSQIAFYEETKQRISQKLTFDGIFELILEVAKSDIMAHYALIAILREIMARNFPEQHSANVNQTTISFNEIYSDCKQAQNDYKLLCLRIDKTLKPPMNLLDAKNNLCKFVKLHLLLGDFDHSLYTRELFDIVFPSCHYTVQEIINIEVKLQWAYQNRKGFIPWHKGIPLLYQDIYPAYFIVTVYDEDLTLFDQVANRIDVVETNDESRMNNLLTP